ncbi:MAG: aminomethyl transferase family protein, partial [Burkholderiales bacterium]|nr:aminomethyl transferase family protein [Burkholderiales bacterium]
MRKQIEAGNPPFKNTLVGLALGGKPIDDYAPDFWLISKADSSDPIGYVTS